MAANLNPIFVKESNIGFGEITAANTARDGSGTLVTVFTAGADGSRVDSVTFTSAQATPAGMSAMVWRLFFTDSTGANTRLLHELAQATVTPSNTAIGATQTIPFGNGFLLAPGEQLKVSQSVYNGVQDKVHVVTRGGNY